MTYGKLNTN